MKEEPPTPSWEADSGSGSLVLPFVHQGPGLCRPSFTLPRHEPAASCLLIQAREPANGHRPPPSQLALLCSGSPLESGSATKGEGL